MNKEKHKQIALWSISITSTVVLIAGSFIELFRELGSIESFIPRWLIIVMPSFLFVVFSSSVIIATCYYFRLLLKSTISSMLLLFIWMSILIMTWKFKLFEWGLIILFPIIIYEILYLYSLKTSNAKP